MIQINKRDLISDKTIYFYDSIGSICRNMASSRHTKQPTVTASLESLTGKVRGYKAVQKPESFLLSSKKDSLLCKLRSSDQRTDDSLPDIYMKYFFGASVYWPLHVDFNQSTHHWAKQITDDGKYYRQSARNHSCVNKVPS